MSQADYASLLQTSIKEELEFLLQTYFSSGLNILAAVAIGFVLIFFLAIVEQQATKFQWTRKPSTLLSWGARKCESLFSYCGKCFAHLCSFLIQIKDFAFTYLKDLLPYFLAVFIPVIELILSPLHIFKGYVQQCWRYFKFTSSATDIVVAAEPNLAEEIKRGRGRKKTVETHNPPIFVEDHCTNFILLTVGTLLVLVSIGACFFYALPLFPLF